MTFLASSTYRRFLGILIVVVAALLPAIATAQDAAPDEIALDRSEPRSNAVLAEAPEVVALTFSTAIDPNRSSVRMVGADGTDLSGTTLARPDEDTITVTLPGDLPNGTWLVAWDVVATNDDATGTGFFGFTIGTEQDVAPLTIPDTGFESRGASQWVAIAAQGTILLGVLLLTAIWPMRALAAWTVPAGRVQAIALVAAVIAVAGVIARLGTLAWTTSGDSWLDGLQTTLRDADTGAPLLAVLGLVSLHVLVLALSADRHRHMPWLTTVALPVPLVLLSHAADEPAGRAPAMTATWLVFMALALLVGGGILQVVSREHARRFGLIVAVALPVFALGSAYLLWLFTGNRAALDDTDYGIAARITVATAMLVAIALVGSLLIVRRTGASRPFFAPAALGIALIFGIGSLMVLDTARAELTRDASQRAVPLTLGTDRAQLILAPGAAGVNHMRLEIDRSSIPRQTTATLTMALPSQPDLGNETVTLSRVAGNAFEYHGSELAVADRWSLQVALTDPGQPTVSGTADLDLDREAADIDVPGVPWRFTGFAGSAGVLLVAVGIAGVAIGLAAGRSPLRLESGGLGLAAVVLAAILLGQGRLDPILAMGGNGGGAINPDDLTMISRGEAVYQEACLVCHGPELRGDGPAAGGMQPPPADFAEPHTMVHDEATLIYWVRNGKQGTAMPAFGDRLTDQEIADVLSYIEREQRDLAATPDPEE